MREAIALAAAFFGFSIAATVAFLVWTHTIYAVAAGPLFKIGVVATAALILAAALTAFWAYSTRPKPPKN